MNSFVSLSGLGIATPRKIYATFDHTEASMLTKCIEDSEIELIYISHSTDKKLLQDESKDADEDEDDDDDEMDYEGSTQELLANVDCLLSTDGGSSQVRR